MFAYFDGVTMWSQEALSCAQVQGGYKSWVRFALQPIGLVCARYLQAPMPTQKSPPHAGGLSFAFFFFSVLKACNGQLMAETVWYYGRDKNVCL